MRKIFLASVLLTTVAFTGCLKDEEFQENKYGINDPDDSPIGVGFPWAYATDVNISSVAVSTNAQTIQTPTILLLGGEPAQKDVKVTLTLDTSLITAYNRANPTSTQLTQFGTGQFAIPSYVVTIPKGERLGTLSVQIPSTAPLDLSKVYGLAFRITAIDDPSYRIASNLDQLVIGINVKNKWDGMYATGGYFFHPSGPRAMKDRKRLATVSGIGCRAGLGDLYSQNYYFDFEIDTLVIPNVLKNWVARGATPPAPSSGFMTQDVPNPSGVVFPSPVPPGSSPWLHSTYNNTYVPSTRTFWMHYGYQPGATSQLQYQRQVYEKWVWDE